MKINRAVSLRISAALVILGVSNFACLADIVLHPVAERCAQPTFVVTTMIDRNRGACGESDCSLREAVSLANACPGLHTIQLGGGNYALTLFGWGEDANRTGDLDVTRSVNFVGNSHTVIDGNGTDRILDIARGVTVDVNTVIIRNGVAQGGGPTSWDGGGAIRNAGTLTLHDSALQNSGTSDPLDPEHASGVGGGILSTGTLTLDSSSASYNVAAYGGGIGIMGGTFHAVNSSMSNNTAGNGGGLYLSSGSTGSVTQFLIQTNGAYSAGGGVRNEGVLTLDQGTVGDDTASPLPPSFASMGGGVYNSGTLTITRAILQNDYAYEGQALYNFGTATIRQSAVVNNPESYSVHKWAIENYETSLTLENTTVSGNAGGGIGNIAGRVHMTFSTIANNSSFGISGGVVSTTEIGSSILTAGSAGGSETCSSVGGTYTSLGFNIDQSGVCGLRATTDRTVDPLLQPLTTDSGTMVHPLGAGSPAIDTAASRPTCPANDQRGVGRPAGGGCDRGAYEKPVVLPLVIATPEPTKEIPPATAGGEVGLTLIQNSNCRRGPGTDYPVLTSVLKGQTVQLSGRNEDNTWWFTILPGNNPCWLSLAAGQPNGDTHRLLVHPYGTPPPATEETNTCTQYGDVQACEAAGCSWNANKKACH